jgi:predicted ATPase
LTTAGQKPDQSPTYLGCLEYKTMRKGVECYVYLRTLGALTLEGSTFHRPKPLLLLAYLALEGAKPRRYMAELFFREASDPMNSLSRAVSHLRKSAPGAIEVDNKNIWTSIGCDANELLSLTDAKHYEKCLDLYRGAFAVDYSHELEGELEEWLYSTREILAAKARNIFLMLGESEAAKGNFSQAAQLAEKAYKLKEAAELEPDDFGRVYNLLYAGNSPLAADVRKEAEGFEIPLDLNREKAKAHFSEPVEIVHDIPNNLPPPKSSFVGRDQELIEIAQQLAEKDCRLLTLHGMGGIGKSRTAIEVAYHQLKQGVFKDGIFFIALDALTSADMIPSAIAEALDVEMQGLDNVLTQVKTFISKKKLLLILDNFEHLMDGATITSDLLAACPELKIMVTTREVLKLEEEWVKDLEGLHYPPSTTMSLEEAQHYEAVKLFSQRAKKAVLEFSPNQDNIATIIEICQLVEGAPLALELAATWVRVMTLEDIAKEIKSNLSFLENQSKNRNERHQSIRAVFEHSWKLLTPKEQDVFRKLAVFVGSFSRQAASEVAGATLPILVSLVNKSLLRVMQNGRYSRHFLIYEFSQEKLRETPDAFVQTRQSHTSYYRQFLSSQSEAILGAEQKGVLEGLDFEIDNIYAAWSQFFESNDSEQLRLAITTLTEYLVIRGRLNEGIKLILSTLDLLGKNSNNDLLVLATLKRCCGWLYKVAGRLVEAQQLVEESLVLLSNSTYKHETAMVLRLLGGIHSDQHHFDKAKACFNKELDIYQSEGNLLLTGATLNNLGFLYLRLGQYSEAETNILESIKIDRQLKSLGGLLFDLDTLATLYLLTNRTFEAETALRESLNIAKEIDYIGHIPFLLNGLGKALYQQNRIDAGKDCFKEAFTYAKQTNNEVALISVLTSLAMIEIENSSFIHVEDYLIRALSLAQSLTLESEMLFTLVEVTKFLFKQKKISLASKLAHYIFNAPGAWESTRTYVKEILTISKAQLSSSRIISGKPTNEKSLTPLEELVIEIVERKPIRKVFMPQT